MNLQDFIAHFAEQFEENEVTITPDTRFHELDEWDSLIGLRVISMIDEEYDVVLKGADMRAANTVEELFHIVESKQ